MMKKRLAILLAVVLILALAFAASAEDDDDDDDGGQPLQMTVSFTSKFKDPEFGVCKARKRIDVTFCGNTKQGGDSDDDDDGGQSDQDDDDGQNDDDDGQAGNDDDDGGTIANECRVCGDNQFEYIIRLKARTSNAGSLAITEFSYPVPSADVIQAGFIQGPGTVAPSATTVSAPGVEWDFDNPNIQPGERSEDLFVCSFKGPDFGLATVSCQFGIDAPGPGSSPNCLGPLVDCSLPPGKSGLGDDDDDGHGDDDDGHGDNDDDDDGGGMNPSCPTGPFANLGGEDDDDD